VEFDGPPALGRRLLRLLAIHDVAAKLPKDRPARAASG